MKRSKLHSGTKVSKNLGLVHLEYWKRSNGGWELAWTHCGGSETWARLAAHDALKSIVTTRGTYDRDVGRADYCVMRRPDGTSAYIEPVIEIVPSVGELGYW